MVAHFSRETAASVDKENTRLYVFTANETLSFLQDATKIPSKVSDKATTFAREAFPHLELYSCTRFVFTTLKAARQTACFPFISVSRELATKVLCDV